MDDKTTPYDPAAHIRDEEDVRHHLEAAFEDGTPSVIAATIGHIIQSRGASEFARESGLNRGALYRSFSAEGNPTLSSLIAVMKTLGYPLTIRSPEPRQKDRRA